MKNNPLPEFIPWINVGIFNIAVILNMKRMMSGKLVFKNQEYLFLLAKTALEIIYLLPILFLILKCYLNRTIKLMKFRMTCMVIEAIGPKYFVVASKIKEKCQ